MHTHLKAYKHICTTCQTFVSFLSVWMVSKYILLRVLCKAQECHIFTQAHVVKMTKLYMFDGDTQSTCTKVTQYNCCMAALLCFSHFFNWCDFKKLELLIFKLRSINDLIQVSICSILGRHNQTENLADNSPACKISSVDLSFHS